MSLTNGPKSLPHGDCALTSATVPSHNWPISVSDR